MKIQIALILLCSVIYADAAASRVKLDPCPGHPGMCYSHGPPEIQMKVGETQQVADKCETMSCDKEGDSFFVTFTGCGLVSAQEKCKVVEDLKKPHPECCPKEECP